MGLKRQAFDKRRLTFVVVLALEGQRVSFRVFLALLVCQVCVCVVVAQPRAVLISLSTDWNTQRAGIA